MSTNGLPITPVAPCQCCTAIRCLGQFDQCNGLIVPLEAAQTGTHRVNWQMGGISYYSDFEATAGLNFEVPRDALPYPYLGRLVVAIINPDGTTYTPDAPDGETAPNCFELIFVASTPNTTNYYADR